MGSADTLTNVEEWPGHAVLQVPVPALEGPVRARYERDDPSLVAADRAHVHAHVTVLGPVPGDFSAAQELAVERVCRATEPFTAVLGEVAVFASGIIHVLPDDPSPWERLTAAMSAIFPAHPPYAGAHRPTPHLTIDMAGPGVSLEGVRAELASVLPAPITADAVELVWYRAHETRVRRRWRLGSATAVRGSLRGV